MAYELTHRRRRGLGDVAAGADPALDEVAWRRRMLAAQEAALAEQARFRTSDRNARYAQIAATLAIPLTAAAWRWILGKRSARTTTP